MNGVIFVTLNELREKRAALDASSEQTLNNIQTIADESKRVSSVAHNARQIFDDLDAEFESQTGLNGIDVTFLFFATALQCVRQYVLTDFKDRVDDKTGAKNTKGKTEEHSNRSHKWYNPSIDEIITNPVPFDTNFGGKDFDLGIGGGFTHRAKTLGHDPLLGWVFGTANIATSTLTTWTFQSYHVKTGYISNLQARDKITNNADTSKVLYYTKEKLLNNGIEGKTIIGTSLLKEAIHLKSDIGTFAGLPLPVVSSISPDFARTLADYGIDMGNVLTVGKQMSYSILINTLIAMIHGLFFDKSKYSSWSLYEVKTRKILSYSNLIASASNILYVAISAYFGNENAIKKLDVGGLIITLYRLVSDYNFIKKVKEEFIFGGFNKMIQGEEYNF